MYPVLVAVQAKLLRLDGVLSSAYCVPMEDAQSVLLRQRAAAAVATLEGDEKTQGFLAVTYEELLQQQYDRLQGGAEGSSLATSIERTRSSVLSAVDALQDVTSEDIDEPVYA